METVGIQWKISDKAEIVYEKLNQRIPCITSNISCESKIFQKEEIKIEKFYVELYGYKYFFMTNFPLNFTNFHVKIGFFQ